jgi:hypothetical protein
MSTIIGAGASLNILDTNSTTNYFNITKLNIGGSGVVITNPTPNTIALSITGGGSFVPYTGATANVNLGVYGLTSTTLSLPNTLSSITGIVNKGGVRFIHNFKHPTGSTAIPVGRNVMLGESDGNFTMGSTATSTFQGSNNVLVGYNSGLSITTGYANTFFGSSSGVNDTTGYENVFVGFNAGTANTTGYYNCIIGSRAGQSNVVGFNNTYFGTLAGTTATGSNNSFFGYYSGALTTTGTNNTGFGSGSGGTNTTGSNNLFIGSSAGAYLANGVTSNQTSGNSVFIGVNSKALSAGNTNQTVIGYNATGNGSNTVTIGDTTVTDNYIRGNFNVTDARNFIIGTTTGTKIGTATTQKLSFWNATPIVQPTTAVAASTFATVAGGTNIDTTDTFDGYTIGQVVKALRNTGLLA